ncbi:alpha-hydroxy-acid oxidizing protein [Anaerovorax sp. IOR16]|uniref:alpha-hydroxy-acid oxidizing protein n=1 Tax=Anaerovorax sp. IOR16 TaxID=2773458 RepID=UPI001FD6C1DB|nr:alpha-hydroxy-acid oxidizing protein [Anaerovorax sp. IOR16]
MIYEEVLEKAKKLMPPSCWVCKYCNGLACRGEIPGTGGKGTGQSFVRSYEKLAEIKVSMDTIYKKKEQDCSVTLFGKQFAAPIFAAPISGMASNYTGHFTEKSYAEKLIHGMLNVGCVAFTGDGVSSHFFNDPLSVIEKAGGMGIPTIKPWDQETIFNKIEQAKKAGVFAIAMDVDSAGLPLIFDSDKEVGPKNIRELSEIRSKIQVPFIIKGVMSVKGALKALESGADAIIVSNHGGRVLDHALAPVEVLPNIKEAIGDRMTILIDGAIRTGLDVFKVLALGADGVLIGRPYVVAAYGGNNLYKENNKRVKGCNENDRL